MNLRFFIKCHEVHKYFFFYFQEWKKNLCKIYILIKSINNCLCTTDTCTNVQQYQPIL